MLLLRRYIVEKLCNDNDDNDIVLNSYKIGLLVTVCERQVEEVSYWSDLLPPFVAFSHLTRFLLQ